MAKIEVDQQGKMSVEDDRRLEMQHYTDSDNVRGEHLQQNYIFNKILQRESQAANIHDR